MRRPQLKQDEITINRIDVENKTIPQNENLHTKLQSNITEVLNYDLSCIFQKKLENGDDNLFL